MSKDQIIYHVEKGYLYHLFVHKPVQPFYHGNQSKDFRVIMDPVKKFEGHYEGGGSGCQDVPVSLNARYFRYPLGLRTVTGHGIGFVPEYPDFEMPVNFVGIRLLFGWEVFVSHTFNIAPTINGKRKWGIQLTLHRIRKEIIKAETA